MIKRITYISILILWGCNTLVEQTTPLEGDFYIQDGWLAFTSRKYDQADKHFKTAIETNDSGSVVHFLSLVGLGWTHIYKAYLNQETSVNGFVKSAGENFDYALNLLPELTGNPIDYSDVDNLYAGLALQRAYFAKQKSANGTGWETTNQSLSDTVRILYEESIEFSKNLDSTFIFKHDFSLIFNDIILLRIGNYILLGYMDEAVQEFNQSDFECEQIVNEETIIECLCAPSNGGVCPFDQ